ncbi:MAG TPA: pentapeptide repeat-containing protein, partial [Promineifilum sp.]|nr:pentapeptide repeat-containing protein [Promineifilum sp.]
MVESLNTSIAQLYRSTKASPRRMAVALLVILFFVIALTVLGIQFIITRNSPLALVNLLGLMLIPILLIGAALWLTTTWRRTQMDIARLNAAQAMIESYFDRLTDLLLNHNLSQVTSDNEVAGVARAHTLTTLRNLNGERRGQVVRFLYESALLSAGEPIIDLQAAELGGMTMSQIPMPGINLRNVDLRSARLLGVAMPASDLRDSNLEGADLSYSDLSESYLRGAVLRDAVLNDANLRGAIFTKADLAGANLSGADFSDANLSGA